MNDNNSFRFFSIFSGSKPDNLINLLQNILNYVSYNSSLNTFVIKYYKNHFYYDTFQIPFGEVNIVRDWLKLNGTINVPVNQHPSRLVTGFNCHRSEVSGKRFWEFAKQISNNNPFNFFRHSFIYNYFPLGLITKTGKNITPADFKVC